MGTVARWTVGCINLIAAIPFGIILLLMLFTVIGNASATGYVYVKGIFDFIFFYIFLNFAIPLFIGVFFLFVKTVNRRLALSAGAMTALLLLMDIQPMTSLAQDIQAGVRIGIPWTALLMAVFFTALLGGLGIALLFFHGLLMSGAVASPSTVTVR